MSEFIRVIKCKRCGKGGGTLLKDGNGYVHKKCPMGASRSPVFINKKR
jgi:phage FluMu protein Com